MKLNSKVRKISGLFMMMLIVGMTLVTPVLACPAGKPCAGEKNLTSAGFSKLTGTDKDNAISSALNLKDVKTLSNNQSVESLETNIDYAEVYSLEKKEADGSIDYTIAAVLPVEISSKDKEIKNKFVVAVWDNGNITSENTKVMSYSATIKDGNLSELNFEIVGDDGKILNEPLVSNGSLVEDTKGELTESLSPYWQCVIDGISGDCLGFFLGGVGPDNLPAVCDLCVALFAPCHTIPSVYTCGPFAACMGVVLAGTMYGCREYL